QLAGRPFHIKREFLDDIAEHSLMSHVARLHKALLIMHAPTDDTVGIDNATNIFVAARHPKSFVSLAGSDHLLSGKRDAAYVAGIIAAWAERYIEPAAAQPATAINEGPRNVVVREAREGMLDQIDRVISIEGVLDADQRKRLMEIADKCPVHRTLTSEIRIVTKAAD